DIPLHNELSDARAWPMKIWLYAVQVAAVGGQTTLADTARVFAGLSPRVRAAFATRHVLYARNHGHADLPWQDVFQTNDRRAVERFRRSVGMEFEWTGDD